MQLHAIPQIQERPIENACWDYLTNWNLKENKDILLFAQKIIFAPVVATVFVTSYVWNRVSDFICCSDEIRKTDEVANGRPEKTIPLEAKLIQKEKKSIKSRTFAVLEKLKLNIDLSILESHPFLRTETEKKALPFVRWGHQQQFPMDVICHIVQIFQVLFSLPSYKAIAPDENGRIRQKYLFTNRWVLKKQYEPKTANDYCGKKQYEKALVDLLECKEVTHKGLYYLDEDRNEIDRAQWEGETYRADYPMYYIKKSTTPAEFYKECAKCPTYQLHHGDVQIGFNALTTCASCGNLELLKELLEVAPELVNLETRDGLTPLFWACMYKDKETALEMAKLLIEKGANVNLPCFYAFSENALSIEANATPLCVAAKRGNEELVQLLLSHGAIIMRTRPSLKIEIYDKDSKEMFKFTPENCPSFYGLGEINVDFIISQARSLTAKKALPLMHLVEDDTIPMDILSRIGQILHHQLKFY